MKSIVSKSAILAIRCNNKLCSRGMSALLLFDDMAKMDQKQVTAMKEEMCIAVDQNDKIICGRSKLDCHLMANINNGLIHRAFSVLLFNTCGEILITQRSDAKITFPGVYSNTCCSHPLYNEHEMEEIDAIGVKRAAQRRMMAELGVPRKQLPVQNIQYITRILHRMPSDGIWGEHEVDYMLVVQSDVTLNPDPNEVKSYKYLSKDILLPFLSKQELKGNHTSPWFKWMIKAFLFDWWNRLHDLRNFQDYNTILHCIH